MLVFIIWYVMISLVGWLTLPLAYKLLPALADRGVAFSRALGLLLWGFFFWLLASLGILQNDTAWILFALLLLLVSSAWALWKSERDELAAWLRSQLNTVLVVELLFLVSFTAMAVIRAANPEILGTEKPMELAFINAILKSPNFPPHDPWLSGYAISYYYFGYVLVAMLAKLAGTPGSVAFNLGISLVFALSAIGVYSLVYNLLAAWRAHTGEGGRPSLSLPLLGPLFLLLVGNLEGILHALHTRGIFWRAAPDGGLSSAFWKWLDIQELNVAPDQPYSWIPTKFWWWWRASRVVSDYDLKGVFKEVIDEFPAFSYLLGDLHPHVLAMPFALLAVALALNLALGGEAGRIEWLRRRLNYRLLAWFSLVLIVAGLVVLWTSLGELNLRASLLGVVGLLAGGFALVGLREPISEQGIKIFLDHNAGEKLVGFTIYLSPFYFLFSAIVLGGLAFLNTWDFPLYVTLFAAAYLLYRIYTPQPAVELNPEAAGPGRSEAGSLVKEFFGVAVLLGLAGVVFYLPFYWSFSSQAGGLLPSLVFFTRGAHFWVMFGVLLIPLAVYLGFLWNKAGSRESLKKSAFLVIGIAIILMILSLLLGFAITLLPGINNLFLGLMGAGAPGELIQSALVRRLVAPGAWVSLLVLLIFTVALLWSSPAAGWDTRKIGEKRPWAADQFVSLGSANRFALLLVLFGGLLVIGTEFFYLRDLFGTRMNTIFKFYYQTWMMWSVAAAFGSALLLRELRGARGVAFSLLLVVVFGLGLTYTVLGFWSKTEGFSPSQGWTLDGAAYLEKQSPDDMAAIHWLAKAAPGVVAEAVGGSYSAYARVATNSGQPNVLGWPGHEGQWRGGGEEIGSRENDLKRLYCTRNWDEAKAIIDQYNISYILIGSLERSTYTPETCGTGLYQVKFDRSLSPVFQQGDAIIYEVP